MGCFEEMPPKQIVFNRLDSNEHDQTNKQFPHPRSYTVVSRLKYNLQ